METLSTEAKLSNRAITEEYPYIYLALKKVCHVEFTLNRMKKRQNAFTADLSLIASPKQIITISRAAKEHLLIISNKSCTEQGYKEFIKNFNIISIPGILMIEPWTMPLPAKSK